MTQKRSLAPLVIGFVILILVRVFGPIQPYITWTHTTTRIANAILIIAGSFLVSQAINKITVDRQLRRIAQTIVWIGALVLLFFAYHDQLIAFSISLGILAGVLTLIFQAPLLSIAAWVYIATSSAYRRGDRIRVGNLKGEVMSINPIRTEILEVGGEYVSADLPSGRIFTFPNSIVLREPVCNYTHEFDYMWADVFFHLGYGTDFEFFMSKINDLLEKRYKDFLPTVKDNFQDILRTHWIKAPYPGINFNLIADRGWMTMHVIFPVDPRLLAKETTDVTNEILKLFQKHKRKVEFPRGLN